MAAIQSIYATLRLSFPKLWDVCSLPSPSRAAFVLLEGKSFLLDGDFAGWDESGFLCDIFGIPGTGA